MEGSLELQLVTASVSMALSPVNVISPDRGIQLHELYSKPNILNKIQTHTRDSAYVHSSK